MATKTWDYRSGRQVTVDADARLVRWECWIPGSEGASEQALAAFLEHPPADELPRRTVIEVLAFLGRDRCDWFDPAATLVVRVRHGRGLRISVGPATATPSTPCTPRIGGMSCFFGPSSAHTPRMGCSGGSGGRPATAFSWCEQPLFLAASTQP